MSLCHKFKPHITLSRIKQIHDYRAFKERLEKYRGKIVGYVETPVRLYRSKIQKEGPEYTIVL